MSVNFIEETPNPAMESESLTDKQRETKLMGCECKNLLSEIDRLEKRREMLSSRLRNAMDLAFATVNINDSTQTRTLTQASVRDSAAMRQVSFFPVTNHRPDNDKLPLDFIPHYGLPTSKLDRRKRGVLCVKPI